MDGGADKFVATSLLVTTVTLAPNFSVDPAAPNALVRGLVLKVIGDATVPACTGLCTSPSLWVTRLLVVCARAVVYKTDGEARAIALTIKATPGVEMRRIVRVPKINKSDYLLIQ